MTIVEHPNDTTSNGRKVSPSELNGCTGELTPISRLRQSIPQICAVSAKNLLLITFGSTLGFPTVLVREATDHTLDIPATVEETSWLSSINLFAVPLGCLISGPLSQIVGRKRSMFLANAPFITAFLLLHYAKNTAMLYVALALTGLTGGMIEGPVLTYVAEVTEPHLRGLLSATSTMSVIFGVLTQLLAGKWLDWRQLALMNVAFPVMCAIALALVPESPYWLAGKGRIKDAEKSLRFLRGWVGPANVRDELKSIIMTIQQPADRRDTDDTKGEKFWEPYFRKSVAKGFLLVTTGFFVAAFGGSATLQTFANMIFVSVKSPINDRTAVVWLGIAEFVGTFVCVLSIHFTGKRKITFFSIAGTGLCFFFTAIYSYLLKGDHIHSEAWTWLPTTLLISSAFLSHVGIRLLSWVLTGEVFPAKVRSGATGVAASIGYIFLSIVNKVFLSMVDAMELPGTFIFYAGINLLGGIVLYFILPETEGRTLREIEEHYAGINNLKNKPKKEALPMKEKWAASNPTIINDDVESKL